jgi:hypothetical protein
LMFALGRDGLRGAIAHLSTRMPSTSRCCPIRWR